MNNPTPHKMKVALIGNPNSGKTAIFNLLTGMEQKVSNYPGITVEKKSGIMHGDDGHSVEILDMPGTYSLIPGSMDESIVTQQISQWAGNKDKPDAVISVVDASNLERNLFLTSQLLDLDIPVIIALNMMDLVENGDMPDPELIKSRLGVQAVIPMSALKQEGIQNLKDELFELPSEIELNNRQMLDDSYEWSEQIDSIANLIAKNNGNITAFTKAQALRCLTSERMLQHLDVNENAKTEILSLRSEIVKSAMKAGKLNSLMEPVLRYKWLKDQLDKTQEIDTVKVVSVSERVDGILTHPALGMGIFIMLLYFIFQSIFSWASAPMDFIDGFIVSLGEFAGGLIPPGLVHDLVVEGIIAGVGAILIFLPQILILIFFLVLLEDSGYMARVAFMMDRIMSSAGLHGKSILPLMSGYACAIPGIMSSRTIESWKERLVTMLVLPLMSCSARLPVYSLLIGAFVPPVTILGFEAQGLTMVFAYFLGTITAFILALVFSRFLLEDEPQTSSFIMEMPPYRMPLWRSVFRQVYGRGMGFVKDAGQIIMAISIVLWFLASFPKNDLGESVPINQSYAGKVGQLIEPVIEPLGYDWKIGISLITSFAAREVLVSTLATIYNVEAEDGNVVPLKTAMQKEMNPKTGKQQYSMLVALSLLVFYVYAAQCMATFAIIKKETNSWKWPAFMILYMTLLAYGGAFAVYQGGLMLGIG